MDQPVSADESVNEPRRRLYGVPYAALTLAALLCIAFIAELRLDFLPAGGYEPNVLTTGALGGLNWYMVLDGGWYRLLTASFLHGSPLHLTLNVMALIFAGAMLEPLVGRLWFITIFFVGAVAGAALSLLWNPATMIGVGASGAIMGLFAALVACSFWFPPGQERNRLLVNSLQVLVPSLIPIVLTSMSSSRVFVDYASHVGGALGGFLIALYILSQWPRSEPRPAGDLTAKIICAAAALVIATAIMPISNTYARYSGLAAVLIPASEVPPNDNEIRRTARLLSVNYPRDPRARLYHGLVLMEQKDAAGAQQQFRTALDEREILTLFFSNLEPLLRRNLAASLNLAGGLAMEKGDIDTAFARFVEAMQVDPAQPDAISNRGFAYLRKGELNAAISDFSAAIARDPKFARGYNNRSEAHVRKGDYDAALADIESSLRIMPGVPALYARRGMIRFMAGHFVGAVEDLRIAADGDRASIGYDPLYGAFWLYFAHARSGGDGPKELSSRLSRYDLSKWPYPIVDILLDKKSPDDVLNEQLKSGELCEARFYTAQLYLVRGRRTDAIELLRAILDSDCPNTFVEYEGARAELIRMKALQ